MTDLNIMKENNNILIITLPENWKTLHVVGSGITAIYTQKLIIEDGRDNSVLCHFQGIPGMKGDIAPIPAIPDSCSKGQIYDGNKWELDKDSDSGLSQIKLIYEFEEPNGKKFNAANNVWSSQTSFSAGSFDVYHIQTHSEDWIDNDKNDTYAEVFIIAS